MTTVAMTPEASLRDTTGGPSPYLNPGEPLQKTVSPLDKSDIKSRIDQILNRHPAVGFGLGVVRNGSLEFFYGHGLADIATNTAVTEDTVFRICSITKVFTAIAVMQLWEQGLIDLDAPANDYLRAYKLILTKPSFRPATVRHLLTHTAGVPEELRASDLFRPDWGETVKLGQPIPSLAEFYAPGLRLYAEPGTSFRYGDHGFATLGQVVEDVSEEPLDHYFREHIFKPLGMADTDLVRSERVKSRLATAYTLGSSGAKPVTPREGITRGASNIYSTTRDMARFIAALLGGGANEHGSMLEPATLATMFEPHYQPDPRLPGMGLGFVLDDAASHLVIGHPGIMPGFNAQLFAAPRDGVGVIGFTNGAHEAVFWLGTELGRLLRYLLGVPDAVVRTDIPQHPEIWRDLCGWYHLDARLIEARVRMLMGAGVQVFVRGGQLMLRFLSPIPVLYRGFVVYPDDENDPYVFRINPSEFGMPTSRVVFSREDGAAVTAVHLEMSPVSLRKRPRRRT
jgi:CubicO group peptidase (beta-lactamase class C family)